MTVSLAVTVFQRTEKLESLLDSVDPNIIDSVVIADDGHTEEREEIYSRDFPFELKILDLPYDSGVGATRSALAEEVSADYILCLDCDHQMPPNAGVLLEQLQEDQSLGGVAGNVIEPDRGRLWQSGKDFIETGRTLQRSADIQDKEVRFVGGYPLVEFDFVPQAILFRRECIESYHWDDNYVNSTEHLDFFVGHWKQSDWTFGICPSVTVPHYPGGSSSYMANRHDESKKSESHQYFLEKWGYDGVVSTRPYWFDTDRGFTLENRIKRTFRQEGLGSLFRKGVKYTRSKLSR